MDCIVHGVTKSQTWWNDFHFSLSVLAPSMSYTSQNCHIMAAQCESPRGLSHCQRASDCRYTPNFKEEHLWSLGITVCVVLFLPLFQIFPPHAVVRNLPANTGDPRDLGLIPNSWNSPRRGNGNLLQYCCLENWWTEEPVGLHPSGMTEHACMHPLPSNLQVPFFTIPQIKSVKQGASWVCIRQAWISGETGGTCITSISHKRKLRPRDITWLQVLKTCYRPSMNNVHWMNDWWENRKERKFGVKKQWQLSWSQLASSDLLHCPFIPQTSTEPRSSQTLALSPEGKGC